MFWCQKLQETRPTDIVGKNMLINNVKNIKHEISYLFRMSMSISMIIIAHRINIFY